jgi:putative MATE family efflux protein
MVGMLMIGQLGEVSIAAVGLSNQVTFLFFLLMFGITSGAAIFTAQLWGKRDIAAIRRVLGLSLVLGLTGSLIFFCLVEFFPARILGIYTRDPRVIQVGVGYLRIFGWAYLFSATTTCFAAVLRSTGDVKTPLYVSIGALSLNMLLTYSLVFGKFGLPILGVEGAAISAMIARIVECSALLTITYAKKAPMAARPSELFRFDKLFITQVLKPIIPVAMNELLWSLGITTYNVVYARIGTESIAAMNIVGPIDNMAMVIFISIANATAIMVGHQIGGGDEETAYQYAGKSLVLSFAGSMLIGIGLILGGRYLLIIYKVSFEVIQNAQRILLILGIFFSVRMTNMMLFLGVLRSGGDTRYAFILDAGIIWTVGVPLAFIGAFVFHLPIYWVYLLVMTDEVSKWIIGLHRYSTRKWIHNLASTVSQA